jgi:hypothetical protein
LIVTLNNNPSINEVPPTKSYYDRWMELKEALRVQAHAEVPLRMLFGNWDMHN